MAKDAVQAAFVRFSGRCVRSRLTELPSVRRCFGPERARSSSITVTEVAPIFGQAGVFLNQCLKCDLRLPVLGAGSGPGATRLEKAKQPTGWAGPVRPVAVFSYLCGEPAGNGGAVAGAQAGRRGGCRRLLEPHRRRRRPRMEGGGRWRLAVGRSGCNALEGLGSGPAHGLVGVAQ
jgi:hypothetical protein